MRWSSHAMHLMFILNSVTLHSPPMSLIIGQTDVLTHFMRTVRTFLHPSTFFLQISLSFFFYKLILPCRRCIRRLFFRRHSYVDALLLEDSFSLCSESFFFSRPFNFLAFQIVSSSNYRNVHFSTSAQIERVQMKRSV